MNRSACTLVTAVMSLATTARAQLVVNDVYTNLEARVLTNVPVTFSRVGGDGDFTAGIAPRIGGVVRPAQVDVLRHGPDGSIRHALVSFVVPSVPASGNVTINWLNQVSPAPPAFNWAGHDTSPPNLALSLASVSYGNLVSDLGAVLDAGGWYGPQITVVHDGPVMKEFQWVHTPAGQPANQRVKVYWRLRLFSGQSSIRVEAIVENCNPRVMNAPTPLHYQFSGVSMWHGGNILYQAGAYDHVDQTRYRIVAWTDGKIEDIHRKPNAKYLFENKFLPPYRLNNNAPPQYRNMTPALADSIYLSQTNGRNDDVRPQGILEQGIIFNQMPGTGGRWDIGLYPAWTATYLLTHAPGIYRRILHADGNGAGSYYIHVRSDQGYPGYMVQPASPQGFPSGRRPLDNVHRIDIYQFPWQPDHAHAPSLGYMAYILTGDSYYAEEMSFWASYQLGEWPYIGMDINAPERAQAWGFRHVVDAAFLLPDGHPLLPYFTGRIDAYTSTLNSQFVNSGRPIHFMTEALSASGRMDWVNCAFNSNWMASWLVASAGNAVDKGFAGLEHFRDWLGEYIIGFYTSHNDPAHDFVGPDGVTYSYDPLDAMPYSNATSLWTCQVYNHPGGYLAAQKTSKIKNFAKYGEIWYYNKVNQDNEWSAYTSPPGFDPKRLPPDVDLDNLPDIVTGEWPMRPDGWGHGFYYDHLANPPHQAPWYGWHRYGAWDGLVSAMNGNTPGAGDAWAQMLPLSGPTEYGYEMVPQALYVPAVPPPANFVRLEISPHTEAKSPGSSVNYAATAIYRNGFGYDVPVDATSGVTWQSGNTAVASFTGSTLHVNASGLAVVRATLNGTSLTNDRPAIAVGTTVNRPVILYAGWGDTHSVAGHASPVTVTARVADLNDNVVWVGLLIGGGAAAVLHDDGTQGDPVAGDGVYTFVNPGYAFNTVGDTYFQILAFDSSGQLGKWPYLNVGAPSQPPASGLNVMPFASEDFGFGPRLRGVGFGLTRLQPGVAGILTLLAESAGDPVSEIQAFIDVAASQTPSGMNDNGVPPDQFAGDGLFMGQATVTLPAGTHTIDLQPRLNSPLTVGDAYPRLRVHAH